MSTVFDLGVRFNARGKPAGDSDALADLLAQHAGGTNAALWVDLRVVSGWGGGHRSARYGAGEIRKQHDGRLQGGGEEDGYRSDSMPLFRRRDECSIYRTGHSAGTNIDVFRATRGKDGAFDAGARFLAGDAGGALATILQRQRIGIPGRPRRGECGEANSGGQLGEFHG